MITRVSKRYSPALKKQIEQSGVSNALHHAMTYVGQFELAIFGKAHEHGGEHYSFIGGENPFYETVKMLSRDCRRITIYYSLKQLNTCEAVRVIVEWHLSEKEEKSIPGYLSLDFIEGGVTAYTWRFDKSIKSKNR